MAGALCIWVRTCPRLLISPSSMFAGFTQFINQKRTIVEKSKLKLDPDTYPEPWPYKEKGYTFFFVRLKSYVSLYSCSGNVIVEQQFFRRHYFLLFMFRFD